MGEKAPQKKSGDLKAIPANPRMADVANPSFPKGARHAFGSSLIFETLGKNAERRIKAFTAKKP